MKTSISKFLGIMIMAGFMLTSCDSNIKFPPVSETPTGEYHTGQIVWHDLASPNPTESMNFYSKVFGWEFETLGSGDQSYYVILAKGKPIGGIFKLANKYGKSGEWVSSISVPNVDDAVEYNKLQGGKTVFKTALFKGRGKTALVQDPQGAMVAFLHADGGDPKFSKPKNNTWLWNELWTTDFEGSVDYYKQLFGFDGKNILGSKKPYYVFENNNVKYCGVLGNPVKGSRSAWMPYIKVNDVNKVMEKARKAGAYVMMEPNANIRKGSVAVLLDPQGAQFTIQVWPIK